MTLFTTASFPINALIEYIDLGKIGLPELQRPFVWPNVNVRNLFDSLYRGYPAGFLLFWQTGADAGLKGIGTRNAKATPDLAIVDGQQRLTSLYAVMKGTEVLRANFKRERIQIAFNPLSERFEVADAAIRRDKAFIPDMSVLWQPGTMLLSFAREFIHELGKTRELSNEDCNRIELSIQKLLQLPQYQFTVLQLVQSVDVEVIAEIFVRINGEGKKLNQADFILTLLSVFWEEGRVELEDFCNRAAAPAGGAASPFNHHFKPSPDQMLRVTVGLALRRARLENVYNVLRGRDAKTGLVDVEKREEQFALMRAAQKHALNLASWHHFFTALTLAGYRSEKMITSQTAVVYTYLLYLIGCHDFGVAKSEMRQAIAEFFFMASLTGRYTNSPESSFESDLNLLRDIEDGAGFLAKLREICATALTSDFWTITLPSRLANMVTRSPSLYAYQAAQIMLDARVLYGQSKISALTDGSVSGSRAALEQHHLFPRAYLEENGVRETMHINQIANYALLEWPENTAIGKASPATYVPPLDARLSAAEREELYFLHALPPLWWEMRYEDFPVDRRSRMARVVRAAWERLSGKTKAPNASALAVADLVAGGETGEAEFKSTLRTNLHTGMPDERMHLAALKTIAGFLNAAGGHLLVGVADDGTPLGVEADGFPNEDKMSLHLVNLVKDRIGDVFLPYVHPHFEDYDDRRVLSIRCERGPKPAYVKDDGNQRFFVRAGNSTAELAGQAILDYVKQRFH
jgi:hypothetical protein